MGWKTQSQRLATLARSSLAIALGVLLLAALLISASHSWHAVWHGEASATEHACLACTLTTGALLAAFAAILVNLQASRLLEPQRPASTLRHHAVRPQSARGPPLA